MVRGVSRNYHWTVYCELDVSRVANVDVLSTVYIDCGVSTGREVI
jgi:hypothetical protein